MTTTAVPDVGAIGERMLDRLRAASSRRVGIQSSRAYGEALRIAELLIGQADDPATMDPRNCAELLRAAAITLAATKHSFAFTHDPDQHPSATDGPAITHMSSVAECLVSMADVLAPRPPDTAAQIIELDAHRVD